MKNQVIYLLFVGAALVHQAFSQCSDPGSVAHSSIALDGLSEGDAVMYTCTDGYKIQGEVTFTLNASRTCANGSWTGSAPVCEDIACTDPGVVIDAAKSGLDFSYGLTVSYHCNDGYRTSTSARTTVLTCDADETWSTSLPTCNRIDCPTPETITHATRTDQTFVFEDYVTYTCDTGFELTYGELMLMCDAMGSWNGTWPQCSRKICVDPGEISNAARLLRGVKYEDTVLYTCFGGYIQDPSGGILNRTCQADTAWSGATPACIGVLCGEPNSEPPNATRTPENATFRHPDALKYQCHSGFRSDFTNGRINEVSCGSGGTWDFPVMGCAKIPCSEQNQSVNAIDAAGTFYFAETKTYTCKPGHEKASGDLSRRCQSDGTFAGSVPVCEKLTCPGLTDPAHAQRDGVDEEYLASVKYTCDPGYQIQGEINSFKRVLFCQADGSWTMNEPVCEPLDCGTPNLGSHVIIVSENGTGYMDSIEVDCEGGYDVQSGDKTRTCQANKTWSGSVAVCSPISCGPPPTKDNVTVQGNTFTYKARVFYECSPGYVKVPDVGGDHYACLLNKTWGGGAGSGIPTCIAVECFQPGTIVGATLQNDSAVYHYGDRIVYTCDFGHNYKNTSGPLIRTCGADRRWSGSQPVCERKSCGDPGDREGSHKQGFSFRYLDQVNYTCKAGFEVAAGKSWSVVTCQENQTWTGQFPECNRVKCPDPGVGEDSYREVHGLHFQDIIDYHCNEGYRVAAGIYKLECVEDRTWTYPMPECVLIENINETEKVNASLGTPVDSEESKLIGKVCIIFMCVELCTVVILDLTTIWKDVRICIKNVKHGYRRMKPKRIPAEDKVSPLTPDDG